MVIKDLGNLSRDELFEAIKEDRLEYAKIFKIYGVVPIALLFMELYRCLRYHETIEIVIAWWLLLISLYLLFSYWRDKKMSTFEDAKELLLYYDKFQKWFKAPFAIALISFYVYCFYMIINKTNIDKIYTIKFALIFLALLVGAAIILYISLKLNIGKDKEIEMLRE